MADTCHMWALIRVTALAVLGAVVLLAAGQGGWLADGVDRVLGLADVTSPASTPTMTLQATLTGLAAGMLATVVPGTRRLLRQLLTLLHELGHTLVSAALGARPSGIVLRHDASGHATARWAGRPGPVRRVSLAVTAFVGLPAPAVAAAAGAGLLQVAGPRPVLWSLAMAGSLVAVLARSAWSLVVAALFVVLALAGLSDPAEPWTAAVAVGLLTAIAVHSGLDALRRLRLPIASGDDARVVRARIGVPPRLAQLLQVAVTVAASAWCVWLLVPTTLLADLW
jgi:hypothetical protein